VAEIPLLQPSGRDREYKLRTFDEISRIVRTWLFTKDVGHREMDEEILGFDPMYSRGLVSMNVLHYLGLKKEFKGLFADADLDSAIRQLTTADQDFGVIIELLENTKDDSANHFVESLYRIAKSLDSNFEANYELRLKELKDTDGMGNQTQTRKEQSLLRSLLFQDLTEGQCAICHKTLPTDLLVAAHIKPRSQCSTSERKNPNVVMPVCKLGCDDFFEKGYLIVDSEGFIYANVRKVCPDDLNKFLRKIEGNKCTHFNDETADFFSFKREIIDS
jgi:hypothetical protein